METEGVGTGGLDGALSYFAAHDYGYVSAILMSCPLIISFSFLIFSILLRNAADDDVI